jgi:hypothetical protein
MSNRTKKVAAALAAVEILLAEEAAAARSLSVPQQHGLAATSPWALAGRLALMSARMSSGSRRSR